MLVLVVVSVIVVAPLAAQYGWEGAAVAGEPGDFPEEGSYVATNAVARNTIVELTNLETGASTRAIVVRRLTRPGMLARVSGDVASDLGFPADEPARVLITTVSTPGLTGIREPVDPALSPDPDINPSAAVRRRDPDVPPEIAEERVPEEPVEEPLPDEPVERPLTAERPLPQIEPPPEPPEPRLLEPAPSPVEERAAPEPPLAPPATEEIDPDFFIAEPVPMRPPDPERPDPGIAMRRPELFEVDVELSEPDRRLADPEPEMPDEDDIVAVPDDEVDEPVNRLEQAIERARERRPSPRLFAAPHGEAPPAGLTRLPGEREPIDELPEEIARLAEPREPEIAEPADPVPRIEPEFPEIVDPRLPEAERPEPAPERPDPEPAPERPEPEPDPEPEPVPEPDPDPEPAPEPREPRRVLDDLLVDPEAEPPVEPEPEEPAVPAPVDGLPVVDELDDGAYYLQVAAYRSPESARSVVRGLEERYPVAVTTIGDEEGDIYRIFVGPLSRDERGAVLFDVRSLGYGDAFVRRGGQS